MRIQFERSGGVAGISRRVTVDSEQLPPDEAARLHSLVDASGFFELPPAGPSQRGGADQFQYNLAIETPERKHSVELHDPHVPPAVRPLLDWLMTATRKR